MAELAVNKKKIVKELLMAGASPAMIKEKVRKDADKYIREALDNMEIMTGEDATRISVERLSSLENKLMPKAQECEEDAINSLVKIMQVKQKMILDYQKNRPEPESGVERFRQQLEERKNKTTSKLK